MNNDEAKKLLALYRPGTADRDDPVFKAAAELANPPVPLDPDAAKNDPALSQWFKDHCDSYLSIRTKFRQIPVPPGLKERILAQQQPQPERNVIPLRPVLLKAAAAMVLCAGLAVALMHFRGRPANEFETYRLGMARIAMQPYGMPVHTHELGALQKFFAAHHSPADYVLPEGLAKAQTTGGAIQHWQGASVSMLCFHTGQTSAEADEPDLWLFVADAASVKNSPNASTPIFTQTESLATATWSRNGKTYILAVKGNEAFLQKYL